MEPNMNINNFEVSIVALILGLTSFMVSPALAASPITEKMATGLIVPTPEQESEFRATHNRIRKVNLTRRGLHRVNEERARKHRALLSESAVVPGGSDVESLPGSALTTSLSAVSAAVSATATGFSGASAAIVPGGVDNSLNVWFPPIANQGSLGSCVSFATTYYQLSYMYAMSNGTVIITGDKSMIFSPKWTYNFVNGGMNSGSSFYSSYAVLEKNGAAKWAEFPYDSNYTAWSLDPTVWKNAISARTNAVQYVYNVSTGAGLTLVKQLLTNGYILVFGTYVNSWQFTTAKNDLATVDDDALAGQVAASWVKGTNGAHAMTIVGYNDAIWVDVNNNGIVDSGEKGALKIANSWGTGYGNKGFYWLAYDALKAVSGVSGGPATGRISAFFSDLVYQLTVKPNYTPKMVAQFTVNHLKRNQLKMSVGSSDPWLTTLSALWFQQAIANNGGALAFNGSTAAINGTFVIDMTDVTPAPGVAKKYYLGITDSTAGDVATLSAFQVTDLVNNATVSSVNVPIVADGNVTAYSTLTYTYPVSNQAPVAKITATPANGVVPLPVNFSGALSSDADGSIASYNWKFGDGTTGTGVSVSHIYATAGTFNAELTVTDNKGKTGVVSQEITSTAIVNMGDVSGDNVVTPFDSSLVAKYAVGMENLTPDQMLRSDVNIDGRVDVSDASLIAQFSVGLLGKL